MTQEQAKQLLQQGIAAARSGRPDVARELLQQAVRFDPQNETTWLWLSSVARDDKERTFCLRQLLSINPNNEYAQKGLRALGILAEQPEEVSPFTTIPVLDEEKHARVQQALDGFLRRYDPQPVDQLSIKWERKTRRRYGEGGARRLRQITYAVIGLVMVALVVGLGVLVTSLDILGGEATEVAALRTRIFTATPTSTMTPTPGGATPTPFPEQMAVPATEVPAGLEPGSEYGNPPTAIYPAVNPNVAGVIDNAIDYYSIGEYDSAVGTLEAQRGFSGDNCYESVVYYQAMSYAEQGGMQNLNTASQLLEDALAYEPPYGFTSCQESPRLLAGLGYVRYLQNRLSEALTLSERALVDDSKLVQAILTKARVQIGNGQISDAWLTVDQALREWPGDTNLLLLATEIEMAGDPPGNALEYIGKALYVDPALQPALRYQAQIYLMLAEQETNAQRQLEYYGLAAHSAQTLLLYYAGDPAGYLYLAKARIGEDKYDEAEAVLSRVVEVESSLPEDDETAAIVEDVYRTRGNLYYEQGRLEEARDDFDHVSLEDLDTLGKLVDIAYRLGDYPDMAHRLDEYLALEPNQKTYLLLEAQALAEICTYSDDLTCDYDEVLSRLSNTFISALDDDQQADAYSYRAQAQYWQTKQDRRLASESRQSANRQALDDVNKALAIRDRPIDHYYRGLILEELGMLVEALEEYNWVAYWDGQYDYPFVEDDFDERIDDLVERIQEAEAAAEAEEGEEGEEPGPTATPVPGATESPLTPTPAAIPTQGPTATMTPTVPPTRVAPTALP
ncbi:MAG: hypothetical protein JXJ20_05090 [Anaerolineae bacterium]|nr:hypothetical protein [Anaerolineae bacterium]